MITERASWVVPSLALTVVAISDPNLPARSDGHVGALQALLADRIIPLTQVCQAPWCVAQLRLEPQLLQLLQARESGWKRRLDAHKIV